MIPPRRPGGWGAPRAAALIVCIAALAAAPVVRWQPAAHGAAPAGAGASDGRSQLTASDPTSSLAAPAAGVSEASADTILATPGGDHVAEVRASFTPENRAYWTTRTVLGLLAPLYSIGVALLLLFTGVSARLRDLAFAWFRGRYARTLVFVVLLTAVFFVLEFPLTWYLGHALEHRYGLSEQSFGGWLGEQGIGLLVNVALFGVIPLVLLAYRAIEKSPRRWWLWFGLASIPLTIAVTLLQPLVVDPLTNTFVPLRDQQLKAEILALAERAEIPSRRVFEVNKSKQTKKFNAYVSGFGPSQRIVLWDTTLEGMREDEILFVMGHEMGHYKLAHIWKGIVFYSVLGFGLFWLSGVLMRWAMARFGERWKVHALSDLASLPLLIVTLTVIGLVAQPLINGFSRAIEHEADVFGLEVTRLNDAGARAFIKLGSRNKSNPEPPRLLTWFQYSHPPLIERIRFALDYRPWEQGLPNKTFRPKP
jgi:Zn-dependent protease with chaperone function